MPPPKQSRWVLTAISSHIPTASSSPFMSSWGPRSRKIQSLVVLVVLEAMKMEFQLIAQVTEAVAAVNVEPGQQVKRRQLLVRIEAAE